jgi:hypothetical protein
MPKLTEEAIMKVLDSAYNNAINGLPGIDSVENLAKDFLNRSDNIDECIDSLIKWQTAKSATSGFITGIGGLITLPVTIPANLASVIFIQVRMVATIAYMRGYDLNDDRIKTFVYVCLAGNAGKDILKSVGIQIGKKLTEQGIRKISFEIIKKINQAIGFRLLTKFGQKGIVNLGKTIPLVGGLVGGTFDSLSTTVVGKAAKETFPTIKKEVSFI